MKPILQNNLLELHYLCKLYNVTMLFVFGSILNDKFSQHSDIDFLVYFKHDINLLDYADNYFNLKFALEDLFNRSIDLVEGESLKNKYFIQEIEETKKIIYEQQNNEIFA